MPGMESWFNCYLGSASGSSGQHDPTTVLGGPLKSSPRNGATGVTFVPPRSFTVKAAAPAFYLLLLDADGNHTDVYL
ncbi:unnamed protein product [Schistocephalus solidus]|uniref:Plastocyanin-like domain-containing protein n=1 Tax=Schistocephalus solidus TaxID=70667 RepID=A0A183TE84_SCHSO|nr:unnamed protein product [Schistocephalus solidus]